MTFVLKTVFLIVTSQKNLVDVWGNIKHVSFFDMDLVLDYAFSSKKAIIIS